MSDYTISGIDISHHQGDVDLKAACESGQRFCIVKATEGVDYTDPRFYENWEKLLELDGQMYRGAYHFARPDSIGGADDGAAEANDFCDALIAAGSFMQNAMPPALDFEKYSESDEKDNVPWIDAFIKTVEDRLGRSPMIYTGKNVWNYEVGNSDAFVDYPLWLVYYTSADYPTSSMESLPWDEFALWQWSGGGSYAHGDPVPGVGVCDLNWFNGTEEDLARMAMAHVPEPPPRDVIYKMLVEAENDIEKGLTKVRQLRWMMEDSNE